MWGDTRSSIRVQHQQHTGPELMNEDELGVNADMLRRTGIGKSGVNPFSIIDRAKASDGEKRTPSPATIVEHAINCSIGPRR